MSTKKKETFRGQFPVAPVPKGWRKLRKGEIVRATDRLWTFNYDAPFGPMKFSFRWGAPDAYDTAFRVGKKCSGSDGNEVIRKIKRRVKP